MSPAASLPILAPATYAKFNACVHCGLCLPACPTYVETLDEADSPRGRIHLMRAAVDGRVNVSDAVFEHLDRCLVCRACETACPSGVEYHDLLEAVRPQVAHAVLGKGKHIRSGMLQWVTQSVLPHSGRAAAALMPLKVARRLGLGGWVERWMPGAGELADAAGTPASADIPAFTPAVAGEECRGSVLLLRGCVGSVLSAAINAACVRVLAANGFDVHVLPTEPCCGALAAHGNDPQSAHDHAAGLIDTLSARGGQADFIVSPIAGCSAQLKTLDRVLADSPAYGAKAQGISARVRDICEFLVEVGLRLPPAMADNSELRTQDSKLRSVTYHDPCHLAHAQRITAAPRKLLAQIPGIRVVPLAECDLCCGAAGAYSMNQPEMAQRLGERKVRQIHASGAEEILTANIGCILQIRRHLRQAGESLPVRHVIECLADLYELNSQ